MTDEYATDRAVSAARDADWEAHHGGDPEPTILTATDILTEYLMPSDKEHAAKIVGKLADCLNCLETVKDSAQIRPEAVGTQTYLFSNYMRLGQLITEAAADNYLASDYYNNLVDKG